MRLDRAVQGWVLGIVACAPSTGDWTAVVERSVAAQGFRDACPADLDVDLVVGEQYPVRALSEGHAVLERTSAPVHVIVPRDALAIAGGPGAAGQPGTVAVDTYAYPVDTSGCAGVGSPLPRGAEVEVFGTVEDTDGTAWEGFVVVGPGLDLVPARHVRTDTPRHWDGSVHFLRNEEAGLVGGGGVFLTRRTIVTSAELGLAPGDCYARLDVAGSTWPAADYVCDNIEAVVPEPTGADLAVVHLAEPVDVGSASIAPVGDRGQVFHAADWGTGLRQAFASGEVAELDELSGWCETWRPAARAGGPGSATI